MVNSSSAVPGTVTPPLTGVGVRVAGIRVLGSGAGMVMPGSSDPGSRDDAQANTEPPAVPVTWRAPGRANQKTVSRAQRRMPGKERMGLQVRIRSFPGIRSFVLQFIFRVARQSTNAHSSARLRASIPFELAIR